jgi:Tol biopolymer transport system component
VDKVSGGARRPVTLLGAVAVIATTLAVWGWLRPAAPTAGPPSAWRTTLQLNDSVATLGRESFVTVSRDGSIVVFSGGWGPHRGLYLRRAEDEQATFIRGTEQALVGAISPNGRLIAFKSGRGVMVVPIEGGQPRVLAAAELIGPFDWIDDDHLAVDQASGLFRVPLAGGGEPVRLTTVDTTAGEGYHIAPAVLPGGQGVVFTIMRAASLDPAESRIASVGLDGGAPAVHGQGVRAVYAPPGFLLVRTGLGTVDALPYHPASRQVSGPRRSILTNLTSGVWNTTGEFAVADDGRFFYLVDPFAGDREVVTVDRNGATRPLPVPWVGNFESVSLSPNGQRIAAGVYTATSEEIQVRTVATGATTRIRVAGAQLRDPVWAPAGDALYFAGLGTGQLGLYRAGAGADGTPMLVAPSGERAIDKPAPHVDGDRVYFTIRGLDDIVVWRAGGADTSAGVLEATPDPEAAPVPSPDGRWIAFWSAGTGLVVRPSDPGQRERIVVYPGWNFSAAPRWSRKGNELYFTTADSLMAVAVSTGDGFRAGTPRGLFALGRLFHRFDPMPNGEFVMLRHLVPQPNPPRLVLLEDWKSLLRP